MAYDMPAMNFEKEYRLIRESISRVLGRQSERFTVIPEREVTLQSLRVAITQHKPNVLHLIAPGKMEIIILKLPKAIPYLFQAQIY